MKQIINQIIEKLKRDVIFFFSGDRQSLDAAETILDEKVKRCIAELLSAYYERLDQELLMDKAGRKEAGLVVERRQQSRQVLTRFGNVSFQRTYYAKRDGGYCHPVDAVAGLEGYERITENISASLCEYAREHSYATSSNIAAEGQVSRQTVLNKIRQTEVLTEEKQEKKRRVPVIHLDADEDHINLQNGQNSIVPLVCIYEGIESRGKRRYCVNQHHMAFFEKHPDEIWESVLNRLENRYDLSETKIYLHGDGAEWIRAGLEWLPNTELVLDRYHVNKYVKKAMAKVPSEKRSYLTFRLKMALRECDYGAVNEVWRKLLEMNPERKKELADTFFYLQRNLESISIYSQDEEARKGGATEPHVSHFLSRRLSMFPCGWSRKTLRCLVPLLGDVNYRIVRKPDVIPAILSEKVEHIRETWKNTMGMIDPDHFTEFPAKKLGKVTPLHRALMPY